MHSGVGGASERLSDEGGGGGPDPDAGHGGQNLVMRAGLHQGLDLGGGVGPLSVQGDELARQVGQHHASDVGAGDHQQGDGIVDCDLCRRRQGQAASSRGSEPWPSDRSGENLQASRAIACVKHPLPAARRTVPATPEQHTRQLHTVNCDARQGLHFSADD